MEITLNRILVVDEDATFQEVLRDALERGAGYHVETCGAGHEAVEKAPVFAPDLILLDVDGLAPDRAETLTALRNLKETARTPIVFLSSGICQQDVDHYRGLGVHDVIRKSDDPATLPLTVRNIWEWYTM